MEFKDFLKDFFKRIKEYPAWSLIVIFLATLICHGSMLFSGTIGIDTENAILGTEGYAAQGRQGILFIRKILGMSKFNLYLTEGLTFVLLLLTAIVFYTFFAVLTKRTKTVDLIPFSLVYIVSTFWVSQLYFLSQSVPVLISNLLIPFVFLFFENAYINKKFRVLYIIIGLLLYQLVAGTYQIEVLIYAAFALTVFILIARKGEMTAGEMVKRIVFHFVFFIAGTIIYMVIAKLFFLTGSYYLKDQINYLQKDFASCMVDLVKEVLSSAGHRLHGYLYWPICFFTFVFSIFNNARTKKKTSLKIFSVVMEVILFLSVFAFPVFYGGRVTPRMKYVFPIVEAFVFFIGVLECKKVYESIENKKRQKTLKIIFITGMSLLFFADMMKNLNMSNSLYYTNDYVYDKQKVIADNLKKDISGYLMENDLDQNELENIVFMGNVDIQYNDLCMTGYATIGNPLVNWDETQFPRSRIYNLLKVTGNSIGDKPYYSETFKTVMAYYMEDFFGKEIDDMPVYPFDGYIKKVVDDETGLSYLVVKLGYNWRNNLLSKEDYPIQ